VSRENKHCLALHNSARTCPGKLAANALLDLFPECKSLLMWAFSVLRMYEIMSYINHTNGKKIGNEQTANIPCNKLANIFPLIHSKSYTAILMI